MTFPDDPTVPVGPAGLPGAGYQSPSGYGQPGAYPAPPPPVYPSGYIPVGYVRQTNTMAILSLVFAFVFPIAGIILGHMAKRDIRRTGEEGEGLATAGLVISYVHTGIYVLAVLIVCGIWGFALFAVGASNTG